MELEKIWLARGIGGKSLEKEVKEEKEEKEKGKKFSYITT